MFSKRFFLAFLIVLVFVGCSRLPSSDKDVYPIHGDWESRCSDTSEFIFGSGNTSPTIISRRTELEFLGSEITKTVYEYDQSACQSENLRSTKTFEGHFKMNQEQLDAGDDVIDIDITYLTLDFTAFTEERKAAFESNFLNYSLTFPLGNAVDVSQTVHGEIMRFYDIFQITGDTLMFGDKTEFDGLSSANRPETINTISDLSFTRL